jgi:uncharacterized glyoxalase superfamily protein PhnB
MQISKITPNIMVEDVNKTVEFYTQVLDFELITSVPESGQFNWAMVQNGETALMFQSRASLTEEVPLFQDRPIGGALTFYTNVADVKAWLEKLKGKVEITHELNTTFYGATEFTFLDCNGHVFTFAQSN